jgi:hypothetical protein
VDFTYEAEIKLLEGKMKWNVVYFPHLVSEVFGTNGRVPVVVTVDGHEFEHTLLPSKNGHYFVYNKLISRKVGKRRGDIVAITLKKQLGERKLVIPDFIRSKLEDSNTLDTFENQPAYIKREQINHIEEAIKETTKSARTEKLVSRLESM